MSITAGEAKAAAAGLTKLLHKDSYRKDAEREAEYRETLKAYCEEIGEGFKHKDARGDVTVSRPSKAELKGTRYVLVNETFLAFNMEERGKLMHGDLPLVREELVYSEDRRPSITVDLKDGK